MRRDVLVIASTITGLVPLLTFMTQAQTAPAVATPARSGTASKAGTTSGSSSASKTVTGAQTRTRYGPVTVQITVAGGPTIRQ